LLEERLGRTTRELYQLTVEIRGRPGSPENGAESAEGNHARVFIRKSMPLAPSRLAHRRARPFSEVTSMADINTYVEVQPVGGGRSDFLPVAQWQSMDADQQAQFAVINAELTDEQKQARLTQIAINAATRGSYSDPVALEAR
jgi:hypothetical protein